MGPVENRGCDGGRHQSHHNENGAAYARLVFCEGIGIQNLVEERGKGVEEADVNAECDEKDCRKSASG